MLRAEARKSLPSRGALRKDSSGQSGRHLHTGKSSQPVTKLMISSNGRPLDHSMIMFKFQCLKIALSSRLNWSHTRTARRGSSSKWNSMVIPRSSNFSIKIDQIFFEILGYKVNKTNFQRKLTISEKSKVVEAANKILKLPAVPSRQYSAL